MIAGAFVTILARYIKILAPNEMVLNFLLSFFVAAFAYISAKFGLTEDYGKIIIGNIMLLVPGVAFVNALRDMIGGDMMSGILRVCESILLAVFLAAGSFYGIDVLRRCVINESRDHTGTGKFCWKFWICSTL